MDLSQFNYRLPESSIAQEPLPDRSASRMLVLYRSERRWEDRMFREFPTYLRPGDCLVLNNSKVFPARLLGQRAGIHALPVGKNNPKRSENLSSEVEVFLLQPVSDDSKIWTALVHPGKKMRVGERVNLGGVEVEIVGRGEFGERTVEFHTASDVYELLERIGHVPLPPYIKRADSPGDRERYQTVFASENGSVAAPTAGLHFTAPILEACRGAGAAIAYVTLHVGLGTFQPVRGETLHAERFYVSAESEAAIRAAERVICVGTTSVRALESMYLGKRGQTDLFVRPGFRFQRTNVMLTNFHLPQSSLLMLVCAFGGRDFVLSAYQHAVESGYRFYSYGDCMLVL